MKQWILLPLLVILSVSALGQPKKNRVVHQPVFHFFEGPDSVSQIGPAGWRSACFVATPVSGMCGAGYSFTSRGPVSFFSSRSIGIFYDSLPFDSEGYGLYFAQYSGRFSDLESGQGLSIFSTTDPYRQAGMGIWAGGGTLNLTGFSRPPSPGSKVGVEFRASWGYGQPIRLPQPQSRYSQGLSLDGAPVYSGPSSGAATSWGPSTDQLRYGTEPEWVLDNAGHPIGTWDSRGAIVGLNDSLASDNPVQSFAIPRRFFAKLRSQKALRISLAGDEQVLQLEFARLREEQPTAGLQFSRNQLSARYHQGLGKHIRLTISGNYAGTKGTFPHTGLVTSGLVRAWLVKTPTFDPGSPGHPAFLLADGSQRNFSPTSENPWFIVHQTGSVGSGDRLWGQVGLQARLNDRWSVATCLGADGYMLNRTSWWGNASSAFFQSGSLIQQAFAFRQLAWETSVRFNRPVFESNRVELDLRAGSLQRKRTLSQETGTHFLADGVFELENTLNRETPAGLTQKLREHFFGVHLRYRVKEIVSVGLRTRRDYFAYLSGASGTAVSNALEVELKLVKWLPRSLAGRLARFDLFISAGKQEDPGLLEYSYDAWSRFSGNPYPGSLFTGSQSLHPEEIRSREGGFRLGSRTIPVGLQIRWFSRTATDLILPVPLPASTGAGRMLVNAGQLSGHGAEWSLEGILWSGKKSVWKARTWVSTSRNLVDRTSDDGAVLFLTDSSLVPVSAVALAGKAPGLLWGTRWLRNPQGRILIDDQGYPLMDPVKGIIGDPNPRWTAGLALEFAMGPWKVATDWDWMQGGQVWNGTAGWMKSVGTHASTLDREDPVVISGVRASDGKENVLPVLKDGAYYARYPMGGVAEDQVETASWFRLRQLSLTWVTPLKPKRYGLSDLSLRFVATNLLLFTPYQGVDPETLLFPSGQWKGMDFFNNPSFRMVEVEVVVSF